MSSLSEQDHLNPNDPSYYAPRWLRERPECERLRREAIAAPTRTPVSVSGLARYPARERGFQRAAASARSRGHARTAGLAQELDRGKALISVAGRFAAAVGVSAIVALFFVIMVPASRQPDGSGALLRDRAVDQDRAVPARPDATTRRSRRSPSSSRSCRASSGGSHGQPARRRASSPDQLLQQFMQWRQKPDATETPQ